MWLIIAKELGNSVKTWLKFTSIIRILKFVSQKMLPKLSLCSLQIDSNISFYRGQLSSLHVYPSNIFILQNRFIHIFHKCVKLLKWTSYDAEFILYFIIFSVAILLIIYLLQGSWYSTFFFFFFAVLDYSSFFFWIFSLHSSKASSHHSALWHLLNTKVSFNCDFSSQKDKKKLKL